jgi:hypothetical protein
MYARSLFDKSRIDTHDVPMPMLNGSRVRHRIAELDSDLGGLADATDIPRGTLRNATAGRQPVTLQRAYRIAKAVDLPVGDILAEGNDGVPDEPPRQPERPKGPVRRQDAEKKKTGPKRATDTASAA